MKDINKILAKAQFKCICFFKWCEETFLQKHVSMKLLEVSLSCLHFSLMFSEGEVKSPWFFCKCGESWFVSPCWRRKPSTHPTTQSVIYLFVSDVVKSRLLAIFVGICPFLAGYFLMNTKMWQKNPYPNYISIITSSKSSLPVIYYQLPFGNPL